MKTALLALILTGCASMPGVEISEEERKVCEAQKNCSVWSPQDLRGLIRHFWNEGFKAGRNSRGNI